MAQGESADDFSSTFLRPLSVLVPTRFRDLMAWGFGPGFRV